MFSFFNKNNIQPGSVLDLLKVSFPIMISQGSSSLMMFTDRYVLTSLGKDYPSASMAGGFFALLCVIFFSGILTYINPLVSQYRGSGQKSKCSVVVSQGVIFSFWVFPLVLILGYFSAPLYFDFIGTAVNEKILSISYFNILNLFCFFVLINSVFSCFFSGVKNAKIVMFANLVAMVVNIPLTYYAVHFGLFGAFYGIEGAALATSLSQVIMFLIYIFSYLREKNQKEYSVQDSFSLNRPVLKKLFKFGFASGLEFFLLFFAFNTFVTLFHSYGSNEALAMTIVFSWDIIAFLPLWGLSIGVMSVSGNFLGARNIKGALDTTYSGLKIALFIVLFMGGLFLFFTEDLVTLLMPESLEDDYHSILNLSCLMLKTAAIYCVAEGVNMVVSATLRASGDTKCCLYISLLCHWSVLIVSFVAIKQMSWLPYYTWLVFVLSLFVQSCLFLGRFYQGSWKKIEVI